MNSLSEIISLLPKYEDLSKIMKLVIALHDKIDELEKRVEKLENKMFEVQDD